MTRFKANNEGNSDPSEGSEALQVAMHYFCIRLRLPANMTLANKYGIYCARKEVRRGQSRCGLCNRNTGYCSESTLGAAS